MENFQDTVSGRSTRAETPNHLRGLPEGAAALIVNTLHNDPHASLNRHLAMLIKD